MECPKCGIHLLKIKRSEELEFLVPSQECSVLSVEPQAEYKKERISVLFRLECLKCGAETNHLMK